MNEELVTVATFQTTLQADLARAYLESNGIYVFIVGENASRIASYLPIMTGGIQLQVRREDEATARELLSQADAEFRSE